MHKDDVFSDLLCATIMQLMYVYDWCVIPVQAEWLGAKKYIVYVCNKTQEPTFKDVVVVYRATNVKAAAANNSNRSASLAAVESAVTAAISVTSGAATAAADAVAEAATAAADEAATKDDNNSSSSSRKGSPGKQPDSKSSDIKTSKQQQRLSDSSETFTPGSADLNPYNIVIKSFSDVALADLELVFPSKRAEVQPTTLVRSALTAAGAIAAAAAYIHKVRDRQQRQVASTADQTHFPAIA